MLATNNVSDKTIYNSWGGESTLTVQEALRFYNPSSANAGSVQMRYQAANNFVKNQYSKLTLSIRGDKAGSIQTFLQRIVGSGNNAYSDASDLKTISVGNGDFQTVTVYLKTRDMDMNGAKYLLFNMGEFVGSVYIKDLVLTTFTN